MCAGWDGMDQIFNGKRRVRRFLPHSATPGPGDDFDGTQKGLWLCARGRWKAYLSPGFWWGKETARPGSATIVQFSTFSV